MAQGNAQEKTTAEPDPLIAAMNTIMSLSPETEASIRARRDKRTITAETAARFSGLGLAAHHWSYARPRRIRPKRRTERHWPIPRSPAAPSLRRES